MSKRSILVLLAMVCATMTAVLAAAPRVTIYFTDGDDEVGRLVDMGGAGLTVRVDGEDEVYPLADVAAIDFVGGDIPDAEIDLFKPGQHLFFLRNNTYFYGRMVDIGGNDPLRITVRLRNGSRVISSNEIRRILLNELDE